MADMNFTGASAGWRAVDSVDGGATQAARYLDRLTSEISDAKVKVTALLHLAPGQAVLEVGCGLGRDTEVMARRWRRVGRLSVLT